MPFTRLISFSTMILVILILFSPAMASSTAPGQTMKLVFIHHSVGENWLSDGNGGLGRALGNNNYFVSDTNYGWGPDGIGDRTDIPNWPEWFTGSSSQRFLQALYRMNNQNSDYTRKSKNPGGENQIIMFKSCFPNSNLEGNPNDLPRRHKDWLSVGNAKAVYNELLTYFKKRPDKLFIAITAPPVHERRLSANARAFNLWLVNDWLKNYGGTNVAVFDFYNILTAKNNHHRISNGKVAHQINETRNTLHYYPGGGDDHPTASGNKKATKEFIPLLNYYVSQWKPGKPVVDPVPVVTQTKAETTTSEPAKQVTTSVLPDSGQIDGFDAKNDKWETFLDEANKETHLSYQLDQKTKHSGNSSFHVSYSVGQESWATLSHILPSTMDWSKNKGISLFIRLPENHSPITLVVYNGSHDNLKPFDYRIIPEQSRIEKWQKVTVTWDMFVQPSWAGSGDEKFNPSQAMGFAFAFDESKGSFWVDDLQFSP
ncbi:MAG: hypothetical protein GY729_21200 [Desulfobacteraceae bacterium]|nr:hypothetical protein [Desulfobacteraceae bacterium]